MRRVRLFVLLSLVAGCSHRPGSSRVSSPSEERTESTAAVDDDSENDPPAGATADASEAPPSQPAEEASECSGDAGEALLAALRSRGAACRQCFEALLNRGTEARGQIKVALKIERNGEVQSFTLEGDDVHDAIFNECLAEHFKAPYEDSPPENGCVTVKVPLNFSVKKTGDAP